MGIKLLNDWARIVPCGASNQPSLSTGLEIMMIHRLIRFQPLLGLLALLLLTACQTLQPDEQILVSLSFGRSMENGDQVSDADWQRYMQDVLANKTPGFTVFDCQGGWNVEGRIQLEGCKWVIILTTPDHLPAIKEAVDIYRQKFHQHSVLWIEQPCPKQMCRFLENK
ncbi:MAG: DUF3574 domain-containing protein [Magnetococcales bacterium]|nr:DUF3574 domain-containing protein [Magnetococcales bacterium]